jgi:hypothetical protein
LRIAGVGEALLGGHDNVFAPERSGTHPVSRHGNAGNQRPGEPRALRQRFGQADQRVLTDIGHDFLLFDLVRRMVPVEIRHHRTDGEGGVATR